MSSPIEFLRLYRNRSVPVTLQTEVTECGLCCISMISGFYGLDIDMPAIRRRFSVSLKGTTLKDLVHVAEGLGFVVRPVRVDLEEMESLQTPAILHWRFNHFVVLVQLTSRGAVIHDPARGRRKIALTELSDCFTGVAVELSPSLTFAPATVSEKVRLSQLWTRLVGLGTTIGQVAVLSILLQLWILVSPFFLQLVVDDVLPRADLNLLLVLAIGFGLFSAVNAISDSLRQLLFLSIGNSLAFQMSSNVARHLLRLPLSYFAKRHSGDVISRFAGVQPIQTTLSSSLTSAIIDGLMAIITFVIMCYYSQLLCFIAAGAFCLLVASRISLYRLMKTRNDSTIMSQARHDTYVIETIRGINTLRLLNGESTRHARWQHKLADIANAKLGYGRLNILYSLVSGLVRGLENIISIYCAARLAFDGGFSIGMLYAYMSYKSQFISKAQSLVDRWVEFKMLDVYLSRLGDIALTKADDDFSGPVKVEGESSGCSQIQLKNVFFRYGDGEPWVLRGVDLTVDAGQHVAIVGSSGCGKTTLMKIMTGIERPAIGQILIDGEPLDHFGPVSFRDRVGAVMQDDVLFSGSIADNISFFEHDADILRIHKAAKLACIHDDIQAMPMKYESHVGDMGGALSGGQRQRLLLARALYRNPAVLFVDEGTAHLDAKLERAINDNISRLGIIRIVIAHRSETIRYAERVISLVNGKVANDSAFATDASAAE